MVYKVIRKLRLIYRIVIIIFKTRLIVWKVFNDNLEVRTGPFKGMKYISKSIGSGYLPKLLGSYENQLHPFIQMIIKGNYDNIINIGCAEGYYAVGLALKCKNIHIYAYDIDAKSIDLCKKLARINSINNISFGGEVSLNNLDDIIKNNSFIICDIEGREKELLDPKKVKGLYKVDMLIELHDGLFGFSNIKNQLIKRFESTHYISLINDHGYTISNYKLLDGLSIKTGKYIINEWRPKRMEWIWIKKK